MKIGFEVLGGSTRFSKSGMQVSFHIVGQKIGKFVAKIHPTKMMFVCKFVFSHGILDSFSHFQLCYEIINILNIFHFFYIFEVKSHDHFKFQKTCPRVEYANTQHKRYTKLNWL